MLPWIGELQDIYILVASSHTLPPYHRDIIFTNGKRNRKPLSSPLVNFSQCGTWSLPKLFTPTAHLTQTTYHTQNINFLQLSFPHVAIELPQQASLPKRI